MLLKALLVPSSNFTVTPSRCPPETAPAFPSANATTRSPGLKSCVRGDSTVLRARCLPFSSV